MITWRSCAYLLKDFHLDELEKALLEIDSKGYSNGDLSNLNYRRLIIKTKQGEQHFSDRELAFLKLARSNLTYKTIAANINLSERTIDGSRESLFAKLNVQSRTGMILGALRRKLITL